MQKMQNAVIYGYFYVKIFSVFVIPCNNIDAVEINVF
jgi:hypothetical protein